MKAQQILVYAAIFLAFAVIFVSCDPAEDKVDLTKISLWPEEGRGLTIYSQSLAMPGETKSVHYVYVECQNKTGDHPLILWLNGGPGMSSMLGFAKEIGPVTIEDGEDEWEGYINQYAWSQFANLLFFDSPAGVGFSSPDPNEKAIFNEANTANENYNALIAFYTKFPQFSRMPLYIAGEEYGGVFAPWLAKTILDRNPSDPVKIAFKGLILGNAIVNPDIVADKYYEFLFGHQLLNLDTWETITQACAIDRNSPRCLYGKKKVDNSFERLNLQDINRWCYTEEPGPPSKTRLQKRRGNLKDEGKYDCVDVEGLNKALNKKDFQDAFHVPKTLLMNKWFLYNSTINNKYQKAANGSYAVMQELFNRQPERPDDKFKFLIYHGDADAEVPLNSVEAWLAGLGLEQHPDEPWEPWGYDQQTDGFVTRYHNNITFATIRGVGQSAPQWKRQETFYLVSRWLSNLPISE